MVRAPGIQRAKNAFALIGLFGVSLAARAYPALALHFDGLYGQDAYAYYSYGQQLRDALAQFHLPGHFYWPLGYPALAMFGFMLTGDQPLGPQIMSLLSGAAVSVFCFLLTVEIAYSAGLDRRAARLAGVIAWAIVAVCGQLVQSSFVIMSDAPALMWATLSAWALAVYARTRHPGWLVLCAFALAWSTMTRWQYGALALPWALFVLIKRPMRWQHATLAVSVGLITLLPQIAHTRQNPDPLLNHEWLQGWSPANALAHDFTTADGTFHYDQDPAQYYAQPLNNVYFASPLYVPLILIGIAALDQARTWLVLLIGWFAVEYGFLAGIPYENIRFALAIVPPLAVCAGLGTARLFRSLRGEAVIQFALVLAIVSGLIGTLIASVPIISGFIAAKDADLAAARWVESQISEAGARVYCLDLLLTMEHYTRLHPVQIYEMTPAQLNKQLQDGQPGYAVFNVWTTEHQWQGKSPWVIFHWLQDNPGLQVIGIYGNYTLYWVGGK